MNSPPSPGNLNSLRHQLQTAHTMSNSAVSPGPHSATGQSSPSVYFGMSRRGSLTSLAGEILGILKSCLRYGETERDGFTLHLYYQTFPGAYLVSNGKYQEGCGATAILELYTHPYHQDTMKFKVTILLSIDLSKASRSVPGSKQ